MDWLRRNRRKLAIGGGVIGGLYIVGRLAERQLVKAREAETALLVERTRKANQFSATESTCRHTLASLMPTLVKQVKEHLNTEGVTELLRSKPGPEEKLKLWERLKVLAITQCLSVIVGSAFLAVMLRTQLNLLAGALYQQEMSTSTPARMSPALQQAFLNCSHYFVTEGVAQLCESLRSCITSNLSLPLNARLTISELEAHLMQLFDLVRGDQSGIFSDPAPCFISREDLTNLTPEEREKLMHLLADSLDVLESEDTAELLAVVCRQGLAHILDRVVDHYSISPLPNMNKASHSTESDSDSGFVSPASVALPLARLLPILSAVLDEEGGEPWLNHLQESPSLQRQAANVYETFSFPSSSSVEDGGWGWTSTITKTLNSLWTSTSSPDTN